jgi:hypothetical protein
MARSISVKVPTATLVQTIENKIAEIDKAIAEYPAKREQFEKDLAKYKTKLIEFVSGFIVGNAHLIGEQYDSVIRLSTLRGNNRVELEFEPDSIEGFPKRPTEPTRPNQQTYYGRDYSTQKELLEKNLKILKMTSQEEVSASTYGAVMELL